MGTKIYDGEKDFGWGQRFLMGMEFPSWVKKYQLGRTIKMWTENYDIDRKK